jgi:hypothetical protein
MRARPVRLLALAAGFLVLLPFAGMARADVGATVVGAGSADAVARGTTAGIAVLDRATGTYSDNGPNAHLPFGSASLVKLFIADRVLQSAYVPGRTVSTADRTALTRMLRSSDDTAANSFWGRFGANAIVTDVAEAYGLTETAPPANPRYWGLTQVTAHDMVTFYDGLLSGSGGLNATDRSWIVAQLRASTPTGTDGVYQWFGLHDGLPGEPVIGVKQGWMCCFSDGYIWRHSTGIVGQDSRYVVVVLARDAAAQTSAHTVAASTGAVRAMFPAGLVPRVQGPIGDLWYGMGGEKSRLGLPTTKQYTLVDGARQSFARGSVYWSQGSGAHVIETTGAIRTDWIARLKERGPLGYPVSDQGCGFARGGCLQRFQGGSLYWSSASGPHVLSTTGAVRTAWIALGKERGTLGYPITDEACGLAGDGCSQSFQGGAITSSADTGAHWIPTAMLTSWRAAGAEGGSLGYPTADPYAVGTGTRVDFQRGTLTVTSTGAVVRGTLTTAAAPTTATPTTAAPTTAAAATAPPTTTAPATTATP